MDISSKTESILEQIKNRKYYAVHDKFRDFTMIPRSIYITNLIMAYNAASTPGAIVECGTWKGGMIAGIAQLIGPSRKYYLFDSFEGLPAVEPIDGAAAKKWQSSTDSSDYFDNCTASEQDAVDAMSMANVDNSFIVKGWFQNTLPEAQFTEGISILRMDADWYSSTYQILHSLFPKVNDNGIIIIDDYYVWEGCSKAVHKYLSDHDRSERICSYKGVCFIQKNLQ